MLVYGKRKSMRARLTFQSRSRKKVTVFCIVEDWPEKLKKEHFFGVVIEGLGSYRFKIYKIEPPVHPEGITNIVVLPDTHSFQAILELGHLVEPGIVQEYELFNVTVK